MINDSGEHSSNKCYFHCRGCPNQARSSYDFNYIKTLRVPFIVLLFQTNDVTELNFVPLPVPRASTIFCGTCRISPGAYVGFHCKKHSWLPSSILSGFLTIPRYSFIPLSEERRFLPGEHNRFFLQVLTRAQTHTTRSEVWCANHQDTVTPCWFNSLSYCSGAPYPRKYSKPGLSS